MQLNQNLAQAVRPNGVSDISMVDGTIPVLLKDYKRHLSASYLAHEAFIDQHVELIHQVRRAAEQDPARAPLLSRVIDAYEANNRYFRRLRDTVLRCVSQREIDEARKDTALPEQYPIDDGMSCFCRDWAWEAHTEREVATTMGTLFEQIDEFASDLETALVPGAGTGRFACEIAGKYRNCLALDASFHMVHDFYNLLKHEVRLFEVNLRRSVVRTEDVVQEHRLSLDPPTDKRISEVLSAGEFSFFVGDALDVPLPDESISAIISVYFIDIVPVRPLLREVRRLLKPGGLFLNFGPLRYSTKDVNGMLSGEELLSLFNISGFEILADTTVTNTQFACPANITSLLSHNFVFTARRCAS